MEKKIRKSENQKIKKCKKKSEKKIKIFVSREEWSAWNGDTDGQKIKMTSRRIEIQNWFRHCHGPEIDHEHHVKIAHTKNSTQRRSTEGLKDGAQEEIDNGHEGCDAEPNRLLPEHFREQPAADESDDYYQNLPIPKLVHVIWRQHDEGAVALALNRRRQVDQSQSDRPKLDEK